MTESAQFNWAENMINWYYRMTLGQKIICYGLSILMLPIYVGFPMLGVLLYCALGKRPS